VAFRSGLDRGHVVAEVCRLVPPEHQEAALSLLDGIRDLGWDIVWLQLAALNLAGGRIDLLPQWIQEANSDPRDLKMATLRHLDATWDAKYQWAAESSRPHGR
jgi:hypothetical protein